MWYCNPSLTGDDSNRGRTDILCPIGTADVEQKENDNLLY